MTNTLFARSGTPDTPVAAKLPAVTFALLLGVFMFYGVGFAPMAAVHDAAHDGRHSFAFPCH